MLKYMFTEFKKIIVFVFSEEIRYKLKNNSFHFDITRLLFLLTIFYIYFGKTNK